MLPINEVLIIIGAYLIGSIPFGLVISFIAGHGDIRKIGSGNIGTTNVLRTGSKLLAALTLMADSGKIILAILLAHKLNFNNDYIIAASGFIGHLFPLWLKFKGGKGVASFFGLSLYLFPVIALILLITWIITFTLSRYSSLAAILAALAGIISLCITQAKDGNLLLVLAMLMLIIIKHKDNIMRLIQGTELKFKGSK